MNLQINLFSEDKLINKTERRFSLIRRYGFDLSNSAPKDKILDSAYNSIDEIYVSSIKYGLDNPRSHSYLLGANIDTHFNLEAMNVSKKTKGFVVVYSINKILPIIFNLLCECDMDKISKIKGIDDISDSILNLDFTRDVYVDSLVHVDENLDSYLKTFFGVNDQSIEPLKNFVTDVNSMALTIIKYIVSYLETYSNLIVLSIDKSRILLSCSEKEVPSLEVSFKGFTYRLNPLVTDELNGFYKANPSFNYCEVI